MWKASLVASVDITSKSFEQGKNFKKQKSKIKKRRIRGRWTAKEHEIFVDGIRKYGNNWKILEENIPTRTGIQIRSHAQKFFSRIK
mmetsp:Transcript_18981/g.21819  ORF Transcript_18981/g.21819 Transcript_18981/m.21819 type:complete len:86 (-) Transcript_18981:202-459(-)